MKNFYHIQKKLDSPCGQTLCRYFLMLSSTPSLVPHLSGVRTLSVVQSLTLTEDLANVLEKKK